MVVVNDGRSNNVNAGLGEGPLHHRFLHPPPPHPSLPKRLAGQPAGRAGGPHPRSPVSRLSARASFKKGLLKETQAHSRLNVVVDEAIEKKNSEKKKQEKKKPSATPFVVIAT
mmetsp:Transcript_894/g.3416  ORF Transcript_894/g.3416 Transcript_894/m.3416 type:complete len:113 (+) Transcript_894:1265-1603(+)